MCTLRAASRIFLALTLFALLCSCEKRGAGATRGPVPSEAFVFHGKPSSAIAFLSTQMNPVEEAGKMRNVILKDFPGQVDFKPNDSSYIFSQIDAMLKTDPSQSILLGATHGDLITLYEQGTLRPMDAVYTGFGDRKFSQALIKLSRLNGKDIYYIPWTQASYVMVANKKALAYLPKGADLSALTYGQLALWAKNIYDKTGMKSLGFPAGKNGLMPPFLPGIFIPILHREHPPQISRTRGEGHVGLFQGPVGIRELRVASLFVHVRTAAYRGRLDSLGPYGQAHQGLRGEA